MIEFIANLPLHSLLHPSLNPQTRRNTFHHIGHGSLSSRFFFSLRSLIMTMSFEYIMSPRPTPRRSHQRRTGGWRSLKRQVTCQSNAPLNGPRLLATQPEFSLLQPTTEIKLVGRSKPFFGVSFLPSFCLSFIPSFCLSFSIFATEMKFVGLWKHVSGLLSFFHFFFLSVFLFFFPWYRRLPWIHIQIRCSIIDIINLRCRGQVSSNKVIKMSLSNPCGPRS